MTTEIMDTCFRYLLLWMHQYKTYVNSVDGRDPPLLTIGNGRRENDSIVFDCFSTNNHTAFTIVFHIIVQNPASTIANNSIHRLGEGMVGKMGSLMRQVLLLEVNSPGTRWPYWVTFSKRRVIEVLHPQLVGRRFVTNPFGTQAAVDAICS